MKLFYKILLLSSLLLCSFLSLNAQVTPSLVDFGDAIAFPDQLIVGKSAGMGLLEFIIKDELRDPYNNPAKVYKNQKSSIIVAPFNRSLWFDSSEKIKLNGERLVYAEEEYRYRTHIVPIASTFRSDNFYAGGYASYLNYKEKFKALSDQPNSVTINQGEQVFDGFSASLYAGFFLGDNTTLGTSYNRVRLDNKSSDNILNSKPDIRHKTDFLKAGLGSTLGNTQLYLLLAGFRNSQKGKGKSFEGDAVEEGVVLQSDILIPVSEQTTLAARIGGGQSKISNDEIRALVTDNSMIIFPTIESGNKTFLQAGIGIRYNTGNLELAAESKYQPFWITSESEIDETESKIFSGTWKLGTGVNIFLSEVVNWQIGFSYTFTKEDMDSIIQDFDNSLSENLILDSIRSSSVFITTGITYQVNRHIILGYSFNYNSIPQSFSSEIFNINRNQILTPVINRLVLQYKF